MTNTFARLHPVPFVLLGALLAVSIAYADVDPESFPDELQALEWREVGPFRGGRSAAVTGIPSQANVYYFGSTGGGVWKSSDAAQSWENVSDGYFGGSIGAVAVSEWDPNVVYVGGGEKTVRGNVSPGSGLWKSTDAGDTWQQAGLKDSQHISRIRIHPKNPERLYVAAMGHLFGSNSQRGIYRSDDGGDSWQRVLFVNSEVGAVDLAMDPTNARILYASFWRVLRTPYSLESGGDGSGLYKSVDGGDTWTLISENEGFPKGTLGIIGITVSPTNNKNLYAIVEAEKGGVFRSTDGFARWRASARRAATFICIGKQPALDYGRSRIVDEQGFSAFGKVTRGMDIVIKISNLPSDGRSKSDYATGQILNPPVSIINVRRK